MSTLVFTAPQVCDMAGIEYSKLDYWVRNGVVTPEIAIAEGRGSKRQYSYRNVISLKVASMLRGEGLSTEKLKNIVRFLDQNHSDICLYYEMIRDELVLLTDGKDSYQLPISFTSFSEIMTNKEFFWLIPLGSIIKDINFQIYGEEDASKRVG